MNPILLSDNYWGKVSKHWIPRLGPVSAEITHTFSARSNDPDDDIAWSVAASGTLPGIAEYVARNYPYAKPGNVLVPRFRHILLQRPIDQHISPRFFETDTITVLAIGHDPVIEQWFFQTSIGGSNPFWTPFDQHFFPRKS